MVQTSLAWLPGITKEQGMTPSELKRIAERVDRLERIVAAATALYFTRTEKEYDAAMDRLKAKTVDTQITQT